MDELDEIYEVSDNTNGAWWVTEETFKQIASAMYDPPIHGVIEFNTLSGNRVVIAIKHISSIGVSTREQRASSKKHIDTWKAESQKNEWEE